MLNPSLIQQACHILRQGDLVAFPTETVYGLGADAKNETAVAKIFAAKGRPWHHPLIVHLAEISQLTEYACDIPPSAIALAHAFWPGPLTLVLRKNPCVPTIVTGGQDTIALRSPSHPLARRLLQAWGGGIAAPSANRFTRISPTTAQAVKAELGELALILDGGKCEIGVESTIVDMSREDSYLLRPGMLLASEIEAVLGKPLLYPDADRSATRAPGMHALHYAPHTPCELVEMSAEMFSVPNQAVVYHSDDFHAQVLPTHPNLSGHRLSSCAKEYARELYHTLRQLDTQNYQRILIESVPKTSGWEAIQNRLAKITARRGAG